MAKPILGILGGMGPAATAEFLLEFTRQTPAEKDQDHFPSISLSDPAVPDRTEAILDGTGEAVLARLREEGFWQMAKPGAEAPTVSAA